MTHLYDLRVKSDTTCTWDEEKKKKKLTNKKEQLFSFRNIHYKVSL